MKLLLTSGSVTNASIRSALAASQPTSSSPRRTHAMPGMCSRNSPASSNAATG